MSRREKCTFEEKIKAVEDYLNGKRSQKQIALDLGLGKRGRSTVGLWVRKYQEAGPDALLPSRSQNAYTQELKEQIVREYLDGEGSMQALAIKYGIPNHRTVRDWISVYNSHRKLKATSVASEVYMAGSKRKIGVEERLKIVQYCMDHDLDYVQTASRYEVAYWQVYNWVKKYKTEGEEGLSDRRGRRKPDDEIDETEKLKRRVQFLERELEDERLKNELLKKVQEVERRRYSPKEN